MSSMSVRYAWWGPQRQIGMAGTSALLVTLTQIGLQHSSPEPGSFAQLSTILLPMAAMVLMFWCFWLLGGGMQRLSAVVSADAVRVMPDAAHNLRGAAWLWCALALAVVISSSTAFAFGGDGAEGMKIGLIFVWLACFGGALPTSLKQARAWVIARPGDSGLVAMLPFVPLLAAWQMPGWWGAGLMAVLVAAGGFWQFRSLIKQLGGRSPSGQHAPWWRGTEAPARFGPLVNAFGTSCVFVLGMLLVATGPWIVSGYSQDTPFRLYLLVMIFCAGDARGVQVAELRLRWLTGWSRLQLMPFVLRQSALPAATDILVAALAGMVLHVCDWASGQDLVSIWGQFALMRTAFMLSGLCWTGTSPGWKLGRYLVCLGVLGIIAAFHGLWGAEPAVMALLIHALAAAVIVVTRWRRLAL